MSTADILAGLSYVNAGLQCTNQYLEDRKEDKNGALNNLFFNLTGSAMRIGMADHMAQHGNYWGYTLNSFVPYTDTRANMFAMASPMMLGGFGLGCMPMAPMMPFGGFGFFGGGHHHHHHCGGGGFTSISIRC